MKLRNITLMALVAAAPSIYGQSGSINNTLGSGGTFKVKDSTSDSLLVVKDNGNVGIGTATPGSKLDVAGQVTADRVKVDSIPSFLVIHNEETGLGTSHVLADWNETSSVSGNSVHDNLGNFDSSTGEFTVPRDGFYFVSAFIEVSGAGTNGASLYIKRNGSLSGLSGYATTPGSYGLMNLSGVLKLSAGDVVAAAIATPGSSGSCVAGIGYFSGILISDF